nr:CHAT domain-containing tetratricopeptide repeat protein [Amycolatopsis marina]
MYERAANVASDQRPAEAVQLLTHALRHLDDHLPGGDLDALALRARITISLASAVAETESPKAGLAHLARVESVLNQLPRGDRRNSLAAVTGLQRAVVLFRAGQLPEARQLLDNILPTLDLRVPENRLLLTRNLLNRSHVHLLMNDPDAALTDLKRSLALAVEHGYRLLEAKIRHNLGDQAHLVGDVPEALHHYEQAARIFAQEGTGSLPKIQLDQAKALLTAGLAEEAAKHLDEALPELQRNGVVQDVAEAQVARAAAAMLLGDLDMAVQLARDARRSFLRRGHQSWAEVAMLTRLRAETLAVLDNAASRPPARLVTNLDGLSDRLATLGLRDESAVARLLAVRLLIRRGALDTAEGQLAKVPRPRRTTPVDHRMLLRLCKAELAVAVGRHRSAVAQARAGLTELGWARDRMGGLDLLCGTAVHGQELGSLAVRLLLQKARGQAGARRVLAWQERTRAQVYRYEPLPAVEDPVLAKHINEMRHVQRTVQQRRLEGEPVAALEQRYAWLQREASRLGWYTSKWGKPRPVCTPDEVARRLGSRVLVSLAANEGALFAVVVRDGGFRLVRLGSLAETEETARQLHADLDALAPDHLPKPLADAVAASARRRADLLDRLLIRPLLDLVGDSELVVVPIGTLYSLPWSVLPSLRARPVSVVPSATAWVAAADRKEPGSASPIVLVGGPGVPGAIGEVRQLRSVYPRAGVVDGDQATSSAVLAALDGSRLAHLVAHGTHEPANALFSRLDLVDGPIFAHETTRLGAPPEHVVLAACELAMSHIRPGEEALGFAGTLLASGSKTVVGAVARVGDQAAAETMSALHSGLAAGVSPALALAEANAVDPLRRPFLCLGCG